MRMVVFIVSPSGRIVPNVFPNFPVFAFIPDYVIV
jgi:hypothetical protein